MEELMLSFVKTIEQQIEAIRDLNVQSLEELSKKSAVVNEFCTQLQKIHNICRVGLEFVDKEKIAIKHKVDQEERVLSALKSTLDIEHARPVEEKRVDKKMAYAQAATKHMQIISKFGAMTPHRIAPGVVIHAYAIQQLKECHNHRGFICYLAAYEEFYTSINNFIIPLNLLEFNTDRKNCVKWFTHKDCLVNKNKEYTINDVESNSFRFPRIYTGANFQDPLIVTSKCVNYVPSTLTTYNNNYCLRIGAKQHLAEDIANIEQEDFERFSQITGAFLMAMLASLSNAPENHRHYHYIDKRN